jgi:hypothetical protein
VPTSLLLAVANANQAANAAPVAERLVERGIACHLLVLDPVYHQGAAQAIAGSAVAGRVTLADAPARGLAVPFATLPMRERLRAVWERADEMLAAAGDHDGALVGMDGAFERVVLRRYRARRRFTAILWDALIKRQPRLLPTGRARAGGRAELAWHLREWGHFAGRRTLLRAAARVGLDAYVPGLAGHTPVDVIFTAGRFVTEAFRSQGVTSRIETTGIPRFAELASLEPAGAPTHPRAVVYLTGSFRWHDETTLDRAQQHDLDALAAGLPEHGWQLRIRVHPREELARYERFRGLPGVELSTPADLPLWTELARAGAAVTAMSTAGLEALALGRPLVVFLGAFPAGLRDITLGVHPRIPVARTVAEVHAALETLAALRDPGALTLVLYDFVHPDTPRSAERIAEWIARSL